MNDDYVTFDVFAKMLIQNTDESKQNIHWQSQLGCPQKFKKHFFRFFFRIFLGFFHEKKMKNFFSRTPWSQYYICNICQIKYDYIVRSEDTPETKNRIVQLLKLPKLPSKEAYYEQNSASTKNHKNLVLSDQKIDSFTIKELYRRFYFDFLVLGYGPSEVTRLL